MLSLTVVKCLQQTPTSQQQKIKCTNSTSNILWADYENPQLYYICAHKGTELHEMSCQHSQMFNFYLQKCVHESEWVEPPQPDDVYALKENEDNCRSGSGMYVNEKDVNYYYLCIDMFNAVLIEYERVFVPQSDKRVKNVLQSEMFAMKCTINELNLLWPDPLSLEHYFRCESIGNSIRQKCPDASIFQFSTQMCIPLTHTTPTIDQRAPDCTMEELTIRWSDAWNRKNYFICTAIGEYILHQCPDNFIFNFQLQMCTNDPDIITTLFPPITTTSLTPPGFITTRNPYKPLECNKEDLSLLWPVIDDRHGFFVCIDIGQLEMRKCPQVIIFSYKSQACVDDSIFSTPIMPTTTEIV